jgi:hypothetical protein
MTTPSVVSDRLSGDATDFVKALQNPTGAFMPAIGSATVPSGTAADEFVGLEPFRKGAIIKIDNASIYCGNFGAGTTTVNVGIIYDDNTTYTNDVDAWASASTAPQSGGFVTVDEVEGLTFEAEADGYVAVQLLTAAADAEADIKYSFQIAYNGK